MVDDSLSVSYIYTCDLMSPLNVKCSSNTKILMSSAPMIAFVGDGATKWWIMTVPASSWIALKFLQQDICQLKICSGTGSFPVTVNLCGNINKFVCKQVIENQLD